MAHQPSDAERSSLITEVCQITGADARTATAYLTQNQWNSSAAVSSFYADMDAPNDSDDADESEPSASRPSQSQSTQPPAPASRNAKSSNRGQNSKLRTLRDLQGGSANDDDDDDKDQEYFAGGDKSALAVQDPGNSNGGNPAQDHIRRLIDTARRSGVPPPEDAPSRNNFTGQGQTLGGDEAESRIIPDPHASVAPPPPMVERTLHLWADGFSVDDGQLYRYDDPNNRRILDMINSGSAPLEIMNVQTGQAVDVKLDAHKNENYVQPKKKYAPFGGGGQRLGSPTPGGPSTASAPSSSSALRTSAPAPASNASSVPKVDVDSSQPTLSLQIRLADGTRLPSQFNTTHTVGDVYDFVARASSAGGRAYVMATTFPTKDLTDKAQVLGDMPEFKRGGVVVQKWT